MEIHADQSFGDQLIRNSFIWFSLQPLVRAANVYWFVFVIDGCSCFTANQLVLMCFERTPRLNQQNQWFDPRLKAMVGSNVTRDLLNLAILRFSRHGQSSYAYSSSHAPDLCNSGQP